MSLHSGFGHGHSNTIGMVGGGRMGVVSALILSLFVLEGNGHGTGKHENRDPTATHCLYFLHI